MVGNNDKFVQVYALSQLDTVLDLQPPFGKLLREYTDKFTESVGKEI